MKSASSGAARVRSKPSHSGVSRSGPIFQTLVPAWSLSRARVASPELTKRFQAERGTFRPSSCGTTAAEGRAALEISTTGPWVCAHFVKASQASG